MIELQNWNRSPPVVGAVLSSTLRHGHQAVQSGKAFVVTGFYNVILTITRFRDTSYV
jgi:hypothetical protein